MELMSAVKPVIVGFLLLATLADTGVGVEAGHWETRPWCVKYKQQMRAISYTGVSRCGVFGWSLCYGVSYRLGYSQLRENYCCNGTTERYTVCMIYVLDPQPSTEDTASDGGDTRPWCWRLVSRTSLGAYITTYKCGWWSADTCYRRTYVQTVNQVEERYCCNGTVQTGDVCKKVDSTHPPSDGICGMSKFVASPHIVGGTTARIGEFPWMASLMTRSHFCGGTILDERWILTAAHCVPPGDTFSVVVGEHDRHKTDDNEVLMTVYGVVIHGYYSDTKLINDIAMIKLSQPITFNDYVRPACLPSANKQVNEKTHVTIAGWGETLDGDDILLQKATIETAALSVCANVYGTALIKETVLCVTDGQNDKERSSCYGDSGGPLILGENGVSYVIGITSFGSTEGCAAGMPVVYTNVAKYIDWIDEVRAAYP